MIFVTVGTQLPFDRLVRAVDAWAGMNKTTKVFAQIGSTKFCPTNLGYADFVKPSKANELFENASLIVSHAGMGSVLTALKYQKPILIMPRLASAGEHRNDHQVATAKWLAGRPGVNVAWTEDDVGKMLDMRRTMTASSPVSEWAAPELISKLKEVIGAP